MGASDPKPYHDALASLKSSWVEVSPTSNSLTVTLRWGDHCLWVWLLKYFKQTHTHDFKLMQISCLFLSNRCIMGEVNATVSGISTTFHCKWDIYEADEYLYVPQMSTVTVLHTRFVLLKANLSDHKGHLLETCPDCLLWTETFRNRDVTGRYILQFSKSCLHWHTFRFKCAHCFAILLLQQEQEK